MTRSVYSWIRVAAFMSVVVLLGFGCTGAKLSPVGVVNPRCEYLANPVGIDVPQPELSWELTAEERGLGQKAYQVLVASDAALLAPGKADFWDSGKVVSGRTHHVRYEGKPLQSRTFYHWKVRVWDNKKRAGDWSAVAHWSTGLLNAGDWQAKWIGAPRQDVPKDKRYYINHGYRSSVASSPEEEKWVVVDLGENHDLGEVRLYPVQPVKKAGWNETAPDKSPNAKAYLFPVRFRIDVSNEEAFGAFKTIADESRKDYAPAGTNAYVKRFQPENARYVRVHVSKLARTEEGKYAFSLAELEVLGNSGGNLALDKPVKTSGTDPLVPPYPAENWSAEVLTDGFLKANTDDTAKLPVPPSPLLRKEFEIAKEMKKAMLYVTALGVYEIRINGEKVGDHILAPEWTDYHTRVQYQTYDVTALVREGNNAIGAMLADGWFVGAQFSHPNRGTYGFDRRLLGQMEISYADGTRDVIATDESWKISDRGPIRKASIWDGETYDANLLQTGWDKPGFDDAAWDKVAVDTSVTIGLNAQMNEPVKQIEERRPVGVSQKGGAYIVDAGQNLVGWIELSLPYNPKAKVVLRYGEVLDEDGSLYTLNLKIAEQTDTYIPAGEERVRYEPRFTYHGFRFVEISGLTQPPALDDITVKVVASGSLPAGSFETSHPGLNRLWQNILWTQRGNMHSIPTDCPQRAERAGWMGDAQVFSQTAIFNLDMAAFFKKWIRDIRDSQTPEGRFPDIAPQPRVSMNFYNAPGWADAGVIVPWKMYLNYGDRTVLEAQYGAMKKFIEHVREFNPNLIWRNSIGNIYGDWLNGDTIKDKDYPTAGGKVPDDVYATAFFAYSTGILSKTAKVLGNEEDSRLYVALADDIRKAFVKEFVDAEGAIKGDTQAGYALALEFDLVPQEMRAKLAARMVEAIKAYDGRMSTGIQSTIRLMNQLSAHGYRDIAYQLLESRRFPSWLYSIDQGATTIWERWDGYVGGRGFQNPGMNSFNHVAIGAVGEWMYRNILGINLDEEYPGYSRFIIKPEPGGSLTWAKGSYHSIAGPITVSWKKDSAAFTLEVEIPVNTTANVYLPSEDIGKIRESGKPVKGNADFERIGSSDNHAILKVGSGKYVFEVI